LLTHRQTDKQTNKVWQKHYLFGGGKYIRICDIISFCVNVLAYFETLQLNDYNCDVICRDWNWSAI